MSEIGSLCLMAFALALDGFSVSLGIGMQRIRLLHVFSISLLIGLFHLILPLLGMLIGFIVSARVQTVASFFSGIILLLIGVHMLFSPWQQTTSFPFSIRRRYQLLSLALVVSLDSFPVGISLGLQNVHIFLAIIIFGAVAMTLSTCGMLIGKRVSNVFGTYSEMIGGTILVIFGLLTMLSS